MGEVNAIHLVYHSDAINSETGAVKETREYQGFLHAKHFKFAGDWMREVVSYLKSIMPHDIFLRFSESTFYLHDSKVFTVNGIFYEKIFLVIYKDTIFWNYFNDGNQQFLDGCARLSLRCCSCCVEKELHLIIKEVKKHIDDTKLLVEASKLIRYVRKTKRLNSQ